MFTQEGKEPVQLTSQQIVQIVTQQKEQITGLTKKNEELQRFTQLLQQKVIELKKQDTGTGTVIVDSQNDKISENEQLIKQIKILTQRNEIIENRLAASLATNTELKIQINNLSPDPLIRNTHKTAISNCNPDIVVDIDDDT